MNFQDTKGYGPGVKDYDVCNRPDLCSTCLQQRHLKAECRRLVLKRMDGQMELIMEAA
jgi:hypothetical protein